jgi:hypothetical protein
MLQELAKREARHRAFDKAVCDLRFKYPEYYVEYWSPNDVMTAINDCKIYIPSTVNEDDLCKEVIDILYDGFDANSGTNWNAIEMAVYKVLQNKGVAV